jgi:hypothetical protein
MSKDFTKSQVGSTIKSSLIMRIYSNPSFDGKSLPVLVKMVFHLAWRQEAACL